MVPLSLRPKLHCEDRQKILKYLLEQKLHIYFQIRWLAKLLPLNFEIKYKKGKKNIDDDSLSRVQGAEFMALIVSYIHANL